ncbi:MAG: hypothetical protein AB1552_07390 [Nitrospirota bacterium]
MLRFIGRIIGMLIVIALVFLALSLWQGGQPFRWFGKKTEQAGEIIREKSEDVGREADGLKKKTEDMKETTGKVTKGIKKTGEKIKDLTGFTKEK